MRYVYPFDHKHKKPPMSMKDLLGGKGANLAEMTSVLGLPVPHGFTITTDACRAYMDGGWPDGLDKEISKQLAKLERSMGRELGDAADPLLVSVRSGAKFSMPGMMDTVLNLGLNDESVLGVAKQTDDERFAYDSYRRFISMYGRIVQGIPAEAFDEPFEKAKEKTKAEDDAAKDPAHRIATVDVATLVNTWPYPLDQSYVNALSINPADDAAVKLTPVPAPTPPNKSSWYILNLGYTLQWWVFGIVGLWWFATYVRRLANPAAEDAEEEAAEEEAAEELSPPAQAPAATP